MIIVGGREYGQAAEIAARLTSRERTITAAMIRDWGRRAATPGDRLYGRLTRHHDPNGPRTGTTWYDLDQAASVEHTTRTAGTNQRPRSVRILASHTGASR